MNTRVLRGGATAVLVLVAAFLGMGVGTVVYRMATAKPHATTTVVRSTPDVVVAMRDLAELDSAEYHVERVIDLSDHQSHLFGLVQAQDGILLVAAGDIRAGVDLSLMRDGDVVVDPTRSSATLTLPPPRILSVHLDNRHTYVYSRTTDLLARRDENLETRARAEAERTLRAAAVEEGILVRAQKNAARTIAGLVRSLGYRQVRIRWAKD